MITIDAEKIAKTIDEIREGPSLPFELNRSQLIQIADNCLLVIYDEEYWIVGVFTVHGFDQQDVRVCTQKISPHNAVNVWFVDPDPFIQDLQDQANNVYRTEVKLQRRDERVKQLMLKHKDETISYDDSINAGNCDEGTREWAEKFFPSRSIEDGDSVTLEELIPYIAEDYYNYELRTAIAYKLRKLNAIDSDLEVCGYIE